MKNPVTTVLGLVTLAYAAGAAMLLSMGYIQWVYAADKTGIISSGITLAAIIALVLQFKGAWVMDKTQGFQADFLRVWFRYPIFVARNGASIGFLGTLIGLAIAIHGLPVTAGTDPGAAITEALPILKDGLATAFSTTMVGIVIRAWLDTNWFVLRLFARLPGA